MPLSLCKLVTVHINLFRLPFKYKVYYAKINEAFKNFADKYKDTNFPMHIAAIRDTISTLSFLHQINKKKIEKNYLDWQEWIRS